MSILCLLNNYSKYYNRIIKRPNSYKDLIDYDKVILQNINFNPNDYVNTTQIINWNKEWLPDYLVELKTLPGEYKPSIVESGAGDFLLDIANVRKLDTGNWQDLVSLNFYDPITKELNLTNIGNYDNEGYGSVNFDMEGNWLLEDFSIKIHASNGVQVHVWSDNNNLNFRVIDEIINANFLRNLGWADEENVWGIEIYGSSSDEFWGTATCKDYNTDAEILYRWFVIEADRTRKNQYNLTLRRDLVSDDYQSLLTCVANIDRCEVSNDNPLIYNKEPFTYNQIKDKEIPIYDRTKCPWIVGYVDYEAAVDFTGDNAIVLSEDYDVDLSSITYEEWTYNSKVSKDLKANFNITDTNVTISHANDFWTGGYSGGYAHQNRNSSSFTQQSGSIGTSNETIRYSESTYNTVKNADRRNWINWNTANDRLEQNLTESDRLSATDITNLTALNGKKVKFSNGIYLIYFNSNGTGSNTKTKVNDTLTQYIVNRFQNYYSGDIKNDGKMTYSYQWNRYTLTANNITDSATGKIEFKMTTSSNKLSDAPYRMFAIPVPNVTSDAPNVTITYLGTNRCPVSKDVVLTLTQRLIRALAEHLLDIQLLPFCPVEWAGYTYTSGTSKLAFPLEGQGSTESWNEDVDYNWVYRKEGQTTFWSGIVVYPKTSSFKFSIDKVLYNNLEQNLSSMFSISNKKIQNETEFVRFCSPNYASVFEFSPAKNNGINAINIACTYKPFNPFIVVAPQFGGLYGQDYNDNRGLILAGDFSLAQISDAWVSFQIQNKSYAEAFSREISSMEKEFAIQRQEAGWQIAGGTVAGAASGAVAGGMMGGGYGAAAGAIVGGVSSLFTGIADYQNIGKRQDEALNYKKDMFRFNLENIKAKPDTLQKTSSINANSKYVPFIEHYDCTNEEKQLLSKYIEYNGMSAGFCGPINMTGFVRANIIRYYGNYGSYELNELNNELLKGVYL